MNRNYYLFCPDDHIKYFFREYLEVILQKYGERKIQGANSQEPDVDPTLTRVEWEGFKHFMLGLKTCVEVKFKILVSFFVVKCDASLC